MKFNNFIFSSTIFLVSRFAAATASFEEDPAASSGARNLNPAERNDFNASRPISPNNRFTPTKEQEEQILEDLREQREFLTQSEQREFLTQSNSQSDLQPGARSVAISRYGVPPNPRGPMFVSITYGPGLEKATLLDTGGRVLIMDDFKALKEAQPDIEVITEDTFTPWNEPAKFVKGKFTLQVTTSDGYEDLTLEAEFYACSPRCSNNNIGLSNGFGSMSPLKNQQGIEYMTFDFPYNQLYSRMILQPAYECNYLDKLWIDDRNFNGGAWALVFVNSLQVEGVQTKWAQGKGGLPQYANNKGTMGMLDTGGGPMFLATENIPGFPTIPPPQTISGQPVGQSDCRERFPWINDPGYAGCLCYYGKVEFQLQSAESQVTKTIRWTNDDVAGEYGDPTFIGCEKANIGGGNYVNLGAVMFVLHKITMGVNTYEMCIESNSPNDGGPRPTEGPTPQLSKNANAGKAKKAKKSNKKRKTS